MSLCSANNLQILRERIEQGINVCENVQLWICKKWKKSHTLAYLIPVQGELLSADDENTGSVKVL